MVEQCGEPLLLVSPCSFPHTLQSLGHSLPALGRSSVRFHDVLLGQGPSLHHLRRRCFHQLCSAASAGTMPLFDSSPASRPGLRFWLPRPFQLPGWLPDAGEVSRFSCVQFLDVRTALGLRRAWQELFALSFPSVWPSRWEHSVGARYWLFEARFLARRCLCLHFTRHLTAPSARLEVKMVRYSFLVGLFHPRLHAGLSRRLRLLPSMLRETGSARPAVAVVLIAFLLLRVHRNRPSAPRIKDSALRPVGLLWLLLTSPSLSRRIAAAVVRCERTGMETSRGKTRLLLPYASDLPCGF